ncbi:MAG: hypothetical protein AB1589_02625 [Cyanobacteriota bacterium]
MSDFRAVDIVSSINIWQMFGFRGFYAQFPIPNSLFPVPRSRLLQQAQYDY